MTDSDNISLSETLEKKIFQNISTQNKERAELAGLFIERRYQRKITLVPAGEKWDKVFFIHRGIIRLYYTDKDGREFNKGFFREGQLVWPAAPSARHQESLFTIATLEECRISVCGFAPFFSWLKRHNYWEKFALPYTESLAEEKFLREYEFLMKPATERFRNFCIENPELAERIPDYHLASYLGITNVSLSRIKKNIDFNLC